MNIGKKIRDKPLLNLIQEKENNIEFDKQQAQYETPIDVVSSRIPVKTEGNVGDRMVVKLGHDAYLYVKVEKNKWMKVQLEEL
mgnify:CR=1 FL=1|tara:strand:+ start:4246 stop:4494 length:249 start_codon:yes stop_codon:yes gene_type:complete